MSMHKRILDAMKTKLEELAWANLVDFEKVRLFSSDFKDHEMPAIQIYDIGETSEPVQGRQTVKWDLTVEIVMKNNSTEIVDQGLLFDRRLEVIRKMGEDPTLGLQTTSPSEGRMIHVKYRRGVTDLHVLEHHFMARLEFQALFEEPFVTEC